eukprot:1145926-Pelagomonas_calceolata.AAC.2
MGWGRGGGGLEPSGFGSAGQHECMRVREGGERGRVHMYDACALCCKVWRMCLSFASKQTLPCYRYLESYEDEWDKCCASECGILGLALHLL